MKIETIIKVTIDTEKEDEYKNMSFEEAKLYLEEQIKNEKIIELISIKKL